MSLALRIATGLSRTVLSLPDWVLRGVAGRTIRLGGAALSPPAQLLVQLERIVPRSAPHIVDVAKARTDFEVASAVLLAGVGRDVLVRDTWVHGGAGALRARVYTPPGSPGKPPLLLFFHGGGFVLGGLGSHDGICRFLSKHSGVVVVAVEYRLAPEHPYPAAIEDAMAAFRHVASNTVSFGGADGVGVGGDSAGAAIAAVVAQRSVDEGTKVPSFTLMLYPVVDGVGGHSSRKSLASGYFVDCDTIAWYQASYAPDAELLVDPYVSPLRAQDFRGLPPTCVVTAGFDPFRDEGVDYVERLRAAGVRTRHLHYGGLLHGFAAFLGCDRHARRAMLQVSGTLRDLTEQDVEIGAE